MKTKSVFAIADSEDQSAQIISELKTSGFSNQDISALLPDKSGSSDFGHEHHTKAPEGATAGGVIGAVVFGGLGLLAGVGALAISGLGPFIAAGPLMAALSGAAIGFGSGGLAGALIGRGIPEYEAKRYQGKLAQGNILLSVHCADEKFVGIAQEIFNRLGASDVAVTREAEMPTNAAETRAPQTAPV
jgi:hypothetical protein